MARSSELMNLDELAQRNAPKLRKCLRCEVDFQSSWCGERICPRCKSTGAWRNGVPFDLQTSGRRR